MLSRNRLLPGMFLAKSIYGVHSRPEAIGRVFLAFDKGGVALLMLVLFKNKIALTATISLRGKLPLSSDQSFTSASDTKIPSSTVNLLRHFGVVQIVRAILYQLQRPFLVLALCYELSQLYRLVQQRAAQVLALGPNPIRIP
jgi:hypothetical protein